MQLVGQTRTTPGAHRVRGGRRGVDLIEIWGFRLQWLSPHSGRSCSVALKIAITVGGPDHEGAPAGSYQADSGSWVDSVVGKARPLANGSSFAVSSINEMFHLLGTSLVYNKHLIRTIPWIIQPPDNLSTNLTNGCHPQESAKTSATKRADAIDRSVWLSRFIDQRPSGS
jgi:hypothetical protein